MIDTNKKFNIIFITISVIMLIVMWYLMYLTARHEESRIYFDIKEIENINWYAKDPVIEFRLEDNKGTLVIDGENILNNNKTQIDVETGQFIIDNRRSDELYIRSVGKSNLVLWYNKAEYRLDKEVINR